MHQPKRIVLTKREGGDVRVALFAEESTRGQETEAFDLVREEGWMCHVFRPGNTAALHEAIDQHHEIERHNHLKLHSGYICPS